MSLVFLSTNRGSTINDQQPFPGSTPRVTLASRIPITPVSRYGSGYSNWSVQFDRLVGTTNL